MSVNVRIPACLCVRACACWREHIHPSKFVCVCVCICVYVLERVGVCAFIFWLVCLFVCILLLHRIYAYMCNCLTVVTNYSQQSFGWATDPLVGNQPITHDCLLHRRLLGLIMSPQLIGYFHGLPPSQLV